MSAHKDAYIDDIHIIYNWEYANATARTGATGFITSDIGRVARQTDTTPATYWTLESISPTWAKLGGSGGASATHAIMVSLMGSAYVADNIVWVRLPYAMTLAKVRLGLQTKGTGTGSTKAKVMYHATDPSSATTVFTSETNAPACTSSDFTADSGAPSTTSLSAGGWVGIGFSAICATTAGANAVIELLEA